MAVNDIASTRYPAWLVLPCATVLAVSARVLGKRKVGAWCAASAAGIAINEVASVLGYTGLLVVILTGSAVTVVAWLDGARRWHLLHRLSDIPPLKITGLAVLIAGQRRAPALGVEWRSHLSGKAGDGLPAAQQMRAACGFLWASVCFRVQDSTDLWWKVADKVLASRRWSNTVVWLPTLVAVIMVVRRDGLYGVVANFESLASLCGSLFLVIRLGRERRKVKPPERKPEGGR